YPIRPSLRIVRDIIVYSARNLARYNPINISGYHISEAGANALQELAFTMCNAVTYLEEVTRAGVKVDDFAPRLAFYFVAQQIIAEETRVANVIDPLGGSWYVESLTTELARRTFAILDKVASLGGTVKAIEQGWFQREIAETAYQTVRKRASGEYPFIGVNK